LHSNGIACQSAIRTAVTIAESKSLSILIGSETIALRACCGYTCVGVNILRRTENE